MRSTRILMGMPITVDVVQADTADVVDEVFAYFDSIDRRFSPFRSDSEVTAINRARLSV